MFPGRFRFTDDEAKVIGIDSDGTPTDDASSVSSVDTKRRTPTRLLNRHNSSSIDGGYAISSPSDSEGMFYGSKAIMLRCLCEGLSGIRLHYCGTNVSSVIS